MPPNDPLQDLLKKLAPSKAWKSRELVLEIVKTVIKTVGIKEKIGWGPVQYDVLSKVTEEINALSDETIEKVLSEIRRLLESGKKE